MKTRVLMKKSKKDTRKVISDKMVEVEMLISQNSPDFGEREKGDIFSMKYDLAKLCRDRGLLKILDEDCNGDK